MFRQPCQSKVHSFRLLTVSLLFVYCLLPNVGFGNPQVTGGALSYLKNGQVHSERLVSHKRLITVLVDDDFTSATPGWQVYCFDTIQDGVDAVFKGGTVQVRAGSYTENVTVDKRVTVQGIDKRKVLVDGGSLGDVFKLTASFVKLTGFTISNSASGNCAGVKVLSSKNIISDNVITQNNRAGIQLLQGQKNKIQDNQIMANTTYGILIDASDHNVIKGNFIFDHSRCGVMLMGCFNRVEENTVFLNDTGLENYDLNNLLQANSIRQNTIGIDTGAAIILDGNEVAFNTERGIKLYCDGSRVVRNTIKGNPCGMILIGDLNTVEENIFSGNQTGMNVSGYIGNRSRENEIVNNAFLDQVYCALYLNDETISNVIHHNNIRQTATPLAYDYGFNTWDDDYPSGGNYWSDYGGVDVDEDGIGDTPYPVSGSANQDQYPLMAEEALLEYEIYVDGQNTYGPWDGTKENPYKKIQDGIDAAEDHATVFVNSGQYRERVVVDKPVALIGAHRDYTTVDGEYMGDIFTVTADRVTISGFTITNSGSIYAGIRIESDHNLVENTVITWNNQTGILVKGGDHNLLMANHIHDNFVYGIYLSDQSLVERNLDNMVLMNTLEDNGRGMHVVGKRHIIVGNEVTSNTGDGISFHFAERCTVCRNNLDANGERGFDLYYNCLENQIYRNNLADNYLENARDYGSNHWTFNYWDDFSSNPGYPSHYRISPGDNQDDHPLPGVIE